MTDVALRHTVDDGEIESVNGQIVLADGLESSVYMSLFGGNEDDSGLGGDDLKQWWGNLGETDPARRYRSETQNLLRAIPATAANLRRIEEAAGRDTSWLTELRIATSVEATATIPALNRVNLLVEVVIGKSRYRFTFNETWGAA